MYFEQMTTYYAISLKNIEKKHHFLENVLLLILSIIKIKVNLWQLKMPCIQF